LIVLYLASTLFHATFALSDEVYGFFTTLDFCSIYFLIAGSFTPFLAILFPDKLIYSVGMLSFLWALAGLGVLIAASYHGPYKIAMLISSYVAMGWTFLICAAEVYDRMSPQPNGFKLIVFGGILYTGGVPFNVRDKRTLGIPDHTIWHIFVIAGSMAHYFCILWYVVPFPYYGTVEESGQAA
jgi:hemolysin III